MSSNLNITVHYDRETIPKWEKQVEELMKALDGSQVTLVQQSNEKSCK